MAGEERFADVQIGKHACFVLAEGLDRSADVALLHAAAHTEMTCLGLRETPLAAGSAAYGVNSEPGEEHAISLNGSVVKKALDDNNIVVSAMLPAPGGGPGFNVASPSPEERRAAIEQYKDVGGRQDKSGLKHTYLILDAVGNCLAHIPGTEFGALN